MKLTGGCYCRAVRYEADGDVVFRGQCHCRECQYITGGHPVIVMGMPKEGFRYTTGEPKEFTRTDIENPVTRQFCAVCGTHLTTLAPALENAVIVKVGTLDEPSLFGGPEMVIWTSEKQDFHHIPEGVTTFEGWPS